MVQIVVLIFVHNETLRSSFGTHFRAAKKQIKHFLKQTDDLKAIAVISISTIPIQGIRGMFSSLH